MTHPSPPPIAIPSATPTRAGLMPAEAGHRPPPLAVDHLVVAARSLQEGVAWCESVLGVTPGPGGQHAFMGTHNRLLALGPGPASADAPSAPRVERAYLEIIAIDPAGNPPAPGRRRWFGLDEPALQARLARAPELVHWVARAQPLNPWAQAWQAAGWDVGTPTAAHRETPAGRLAWTLTVRDDGQPQAGGALPTLIEWPAWHPTQQMAPAVLALLALELRAPPPAAALLRDALPTGVRLTEGDGPALRACLDTPLGRVWLDSHA